MSRLQIARIVDASAFLEGHESRQEKALRKADAIIAALGGTAAWRRIQLMAGAGLSQVPEGSEAWDTFADIHAAAVGEMIDHAQPIKNETQP